jgi:hypothetical protein
MTAAEIAAAEAAAAAAAEAAAAATAAQAATNASVLSTITATPVSSAAGATAAGAGTGAGGAGGISSLVNTTGGPTTWEQIFSQGQNLAEGSTELGKLASSGNGLGADMLAKEVGATSAFNTAPTLTQYAPGALESSALPSALPPAIPPAPTVPGLPGLQTDLASMGSNLPSAPQPTVPGGADRLLAQTPATPDLSPPTNATPGGEQMRNVNGGQPEPYEYVNNTAYGSSTTGAPAAEPNFLQSAWKDFTAMPMKDKILTGMMGSTAYDMLNRPKPYEPKKYKSTFKPGLYSGYQPVQPTPYQPQYAHGGLADLGGYSDGGRMLKGPGDGMSDDIPATIANKQPARLANEEFVVPADVVSHLGNGSSEAGAKVLYKMMDRVRQARTGNKKQGKQINPEKYLA